MYCLETFYQCQGRIPSKGPHACIFILYASLYIFHMKTTLDWSFASAMGLMLLTGVLVIYWIYNKLVGVDNIKLG